VARRAPGLGGELTLSHIRGSVAGEEEGKGRERDVAGRMFCAVRRAHSRHWQDTALAVGGRFEGRV
jgi:hypothetical protein